MTRRRMVGVVAVVLVLAAMHALLFAWPGPALAPSTVLALFGTNLYVLYATRVLWQADRGESLALFLVGYLVLFVLLLVVLDRASLFILFVVLYASVFHSPRLLGYFALFVLSFVVLQPFAVETFIPLALIYTLLWRARHHSRFVLACLGGGLVALAIVLLPLFHLVLEDSLQTLWSVAERADVQRALWISVASASVATVIVALWGVPLAYAMARVDFAGKPWVESLIDIPILVPQSVVGIALVVMLGPGSPLGAAMERHFGVGIAGSFVGIVAAQVFVGAPFLIKSAWTAFAAVPPRLELASRTLGASPAATFWHIAVPLAARGIGVGLVLTWSRAISELGAVMLFASSPLSAPILVHTEFLRAGASESRPIAVVLLLVCLWAFVILRLGPSLLPTRLPRSREDLEA